jgi:hypothetical protein
VLDEMQSKNHAVLKPHEFAACRLSSCMAEQFLRLCEKGFSFRSFLRAFASLRSSSRKIAVRPSAEHIRDVPERTILKNIPNSSEVRYEDSHGADIARQAGQYR